MVVNPLFPIAVAVVGLGLAAFALWRVRNLPTIGPLLPAWIWPPFWVSALGVLFALAIFWMTSS